MNDAFFFNKTLKEETIYPYIFNIILVHRDCCEAVWREDKVIGLKKHFSHLSNLFSQGRTVITNETLNRLLQEQHMTCFH